MTLRFYLCLIESETELSLCPPPMRKVEKTCGHTRHACKICTQPLQLRHACYDKPMSSSLAASPALSGPLAGAGAPGGRSNFRERLICTVPIASRMSTDQHNSRECFQISAARFTSAHYIHICKSMTLILTTSTHEQVGEYARERFC